MGANDDREMLVAAKAECVRLERESIKLRKQLAVASEESENHYRNALEWKSRAVEAQATIEKAIKAYKDGPIAFDQGFKTALAMYRILSVPSSTGGNDSRDAVHEAAEAVRRHATPPSELASPKSDALLIWVADWIENPPEWVKVSYRAVPAEQKASE
jgi:hypothetical protein